MLSSFSFLISIVFSFYYQFFKMSKIAIKLYILLVFLKSQFIFLIF